MTPDRVAVKLDATIRAAVDRLLRLSESTVLERPTPDRWTIKQVVGHLLDSAVNNHQRFVRAQSVEQFSFPKYEQNEWVASQNYDDCDWAELVRLWAAYNHQLSHVIRNVQTASLQVPCTIGDSEAVTLEFLIEDYLDHMIHHLKIVAERIGDSVWSFPE